jgi:hypothetical protein
MNNVLKQYYKDIERVKGDVKKLLNFHIESIEDLVELRKELVKSSIYIIDKISKTPEMSETDKTLITNVIAKIVSKTDINLKDFRDIKKIVSIVENMKLIEESNLYKYTGIFDFFITNIKGVILTIILGIVMYILLFCSIFPFEIRSILQDFNDLLINETDKSTVFWIYQENYNHFRGFWDTYEFIGVNIIGIVGILANLNLLYRIIKFLYNNGLKEVLVKNLNAIYSLAGYKPKIKIIPDDDRKLMENIISNISDSVDTLEKIHNVVNTETIPEIKNVDRISRRRSLKKSKVKKTCKPGKILNPRTNRCVKSDTILGQKILKESNN